jgi:7-carboxy-7-deazaguanine synthase
MGTAATGRIAEIFHSIQGEGPTAGLPAVFVRLQGCSVGCRWCDTRYSWDPAGGRPATLDQILAEVGVLPPPPDAPADVQWNVSLKLVGSGVPRERRLRPEAIAAFRARAAWWKLVIAGEDDLAEALELIAGLPLPRERVLLQPEGMRADELQRRSAWLVQACTRHGLRFSPRLHVHIWGARRGV